ncbi:hypothetical protein L6452_13123 [Arctium lappa]|uniref:Uncharacterized protein n=1 Tax=Arctium lappa TaxID=4217 RepID=A0ACB9CH99_ARCLA|nr:hypothetical protein L6452_13123 [Arctium lappa]
MLSYRSLISRITLHGNLGRSKHLCCMTLSVITSQKHISGLNSNSIMDSVFNKHQYSDNQIQTVGLFYSTHLDRISIIQYCLFLINVLTCF